MTNRASSAAARVAVGDLVQWEIEGILQMEEPCRVRAVFAEGEWIAVEGSQTGIPVSQITILERAAAGAPSEEEAPPPRSDNSEDAGQGGDPLNETEAEPTPPVPPTPEDITELSFDSTPLRTKPEVGDWVQWKVDGVYVLDKPVRLSEVTLGSGFLEGSYAAVPLRQLAVLKKGSAEDKKIEIGVAVPAPGPLAGTRKAAMLPRPPCEYLSHFRVGHVSCKDIFDALIKSGGLQSRAAASLGLSPRTVARALKKYPLIERCWRLQAAAPPPTDSELRPRARYPAHSVAALRRCNDVEREQFMEEIRRLKE